MGTRQRKRPVSSRRRRRRRIRRIQAWTARILVVAFALFLCFLLAFGGRWIWERLNGDAEEAFWEGADPGLEVPDGEPVIVLDAGHGGEDQGTSYGELLEKDLNLSVTLLLKERLQESGAAVVLIRDGDEKVELEERARIANRLKADLFVSIHCNYCEDDEGVQGFECYYREGSEEGALLAEGILREIEGTGEIISRGLKTADFRVLRKTNMPAVLAELGYFSNGEERRRLADESYQEMLAEHLAAGILAYEISN